MITFMPQILKIITDFGLRPLTLIGPLQQFVSSRNTPGEKATQHNAYEFLQLKNDYALCKQQKTLLEEDLLDQRQEIIELEK